MTVRVATVRHDQHNCSLQVNARRKGERKVATTSSILNCPIRKHNVCNARCNNAALRMAALEGKIGAKLP